MTTSPAEYRERVFEWARREGITQIRLVIHQPKVLGTTEWTCDLDHLREFAVRLARNAARTEDARKDYKVIPIVDWAAKYLNPRPNDEECAFCRAMPTCPSVQGALQRDAQCDFDVVEDDQMAPNPAVLPPVALNVAMNIVALMEAWCKSVRAEVERQALAGVQFKDWGLELGRQGNRRWSSEEAAEAYLRKTARLRVEDVYQFKLRSPTQIEKLLKPATKGAKPILGETQWNRVSELIVRDDPKPSVKPRSVIKTPYVPKPLEASGFDSVPDDLA